MAGLQSSGTRRPALGVIDSNRKENVTLENVTLRKSLTHAAPEKPAAIEEDSVDDATAKIFHKMLEEQLSVIKNDLKSAVIGRTQRADAAAQKAKVDAANVRSSVLQMHAESRAARETARQKQAQLERLTSQYEMLRKVEKEAASYATAKREEAWKAVWENSAQVNAQKMAEAQRYGRAGHNKPKAGAKADKQPAQQAVVPAAKPPLPPAATSACPSGAPTGIAPADTAAGAAADRCAAETFTELAAVSDAQPGSHEAVMAEDGQVDNAGGVDGEVRTGVVGGPAVPASERRTTFPSRKHSQMFAATNCIEREPKYAKNA